MATEHIFIGGKIPELVKAKDGTILFDKNNLREGDTIVSVSNPDKANTVEASIPAGVGIGIKRFFMKDGKMIEDAVEEALDNDGNQICDCWKSELEFNGLPENDALAKIVDQIKDREKRLDEAYAQINKDWLMHELERIKQEIITLPAKYMGHLNDNTLKAVETSIRGLSIAQQAV